MRPAQPVVSFFNLPDMIKSLFNTNRSLIGAIGEPLAAAAASSFFCVSHQHNTINPIINAQCNGFRCVLQTKITRSTRLCISTT
jgi:hypothetical protein